MVTIAVATLVLRIAIERIIKINIVQNESNAQSTLKLISTALENYAKDHQGVFPSNFSDLTQKNPHYLGTDYIAESPVKGYNYNCSRLEPSGYSCSAMPVGCKLSGKIIYTVTTGGVFVSEECTKKE